MTSNKEEQQRSHVNVEALEKHINRIWRTLGWEMESPLTLTSIDTLCTENSIMSSEPNPIKPDDDLRREATFAKQALESALEARTWFTRNKIPFTRPNDYFAEMIKTDSQMNKIRQHLLEKAFVAQKSEENRKKRLASKYAKEVEAQRKVERQEHKNKQLEKLDTLIKKRKRNAKNNQDDFDFNDDNNDDDFDIEIGDDEKANGGRGKARGSSAMKGNKSSKRARKDSKFGFGGKSNNRMAKQNDSESTWKGSFSLKKNKKPFSSSKSGGSNGSGSSKRPGKNTRMKQRSSGMKRKRN